MNLPSPHPLVAALAAALLLVPAAVLAPTEIEPNDDPTDGAYAGAIAVPAPPGSLEIDGTLADGSDVDIFRLDATEEQPALLVLTGFASTAGINAGHFPAEDEDPIARIFPYPLRLIPSFALRAPEAERDNIVGISSPLAPGADPYLLRVVRPGLDAARAAVKCTFKEGPASDAFSAKLSWDPATVMSPAETGAVDVVLRDYAESIPSSSFRRNAAGTKATYSSKGPGIVRLAWNAKKGVVQVKAKGIDFASSPADANLPVAVFSAGGGVGADLVGEVKAGRKATKVSAVRK